MSPDRRWLARLSWVLVISVAVFCAVWMISPWLYLSGVRVEGVRVLEAGDADVRTPAGITTPKRIKVAFTTSQELAAYRTRWRLPFILARITACSDRAAGSEDEVITQGAGYFVDRGRIRALGRVGGSQTERYAYEAVFDDQLSSIGDDHEAKQTPALTLPGGLCFNLHGATLMSGSVRSVTIPLLVK